MHSIQFAEHVALAVRHVQPEPAPPCTFTKNLCYLQKWQNSSKLPAEEITQKYNLQWCHCIASAYAAFVGKSLLCVAMLASLASLRVAKNGNVVGIE